MYIDKVVEINKQETGMLRKHQVEWTHKWEREREREKMVDGLIGQKLLFWFNISKLQEERVNTTNSE